MRRDVFQAIADPNRRDMLVLLSKKELTLNAIAENFEISRPAVSKHIKILLECDLVLIEQIGRERFCKANLKSIQSVFEWAGQFGDAWGDVPTDTVKSGKPKDKKSKKKKNKNKRKKK